MPFHTAAYFENVDQTLAPLAALNDTVLFTSGDDIVVPAGYEHLLAAWAGSTSMERARLTATSFRSGMSKPAILPDLMPVDTSPEPVTPIPALHEWWDDPYILKPGERLNFEIENDAAGAAEDAFGVVWLGSGARSPDPKGWWPLRATTGAAAMTANTWNNRTLTLGQALDPGRYQLGGLRAQSTSLVAVRAVFPGQPYRPGATGVDGNADIQPAVFRDGALGVWGEFTHDQPPTLDFLVDAADNESQQVILDVRKIA